MPKFIVQMCRITLETGEIEVETADDVAAIALVAGWIKQSDYPQLANIAWTIDDSTIEVEHALED